MRGHGGGSLPLRGWDPEASGRANQRSGREMPGCDLPAMTSCSAGTGGRGSRSLSGGSTLSAEENRENAVGMAPGTRQAASRGGCHLNTGRGCGETPGTSCGGWRGKQTRQDEEKAGRAGEGHRRENVSQGKAGNKIAGRQRRAARKERERDPEVRWREIGLPAAPSI